MRSGRIAAPLLMLALMAVTGAKTSAAPLAASLQPAAPMTARELGGIQHDPGVTPLMLAAVMDDAAQVRRLLDRGADVNGRDKNGMTALMWAAPATSPLLLRRGAGILIPDRFGRTPLHFAAYLGDAPLIIALLKRGAPLEARDNHGRTPLFYAMLARSFYGLEGRRFDQQDTLTNLVDARGLAMELEGRHRHTSRDEAIRALLDHGAAVDAADRDGLTPLMYQLSVGCREDDPGFQALLDKGANVNARTQWRTTPLIICAGNSQSVDTAKLLLDRGADVNAQDDRADTALTRAAGQGPVELVKLLLERGAHINGGENRGRASTGHTTPLMSATAGRNVEVARFLIQRGADVYARDADGHTALWITQIMTLGTQTERDAASKIGKLLRRAGARE
jgi:uncharacterized protein